MACRADVSREKHHANADERNRARNARRYGMTPEEYQERMSRPCEVCGSTEVLYPDHNHETGVNRGTLCVNCNFALGHAGDDPDRLLALAMYVIKYDVDVLAMIDE